MAMTEMRSPMSRIPRRVPPKSPSLGHQRSLSAPSKLEIIQAEFQAKILRDKEEKMILIYQETQQKALARFQAQSGHGRGGVRDYFKDRRAIVQTGDLQVNQDRKYQSQGRNASLGKPPIYKKTSAGRDKSNPLAPLSKVASPNSASSVRSGSGRSNNSPSPKPPLHQKPRLVRSIRTKGFVRDNGIHSDGESSVPSNKENVKAISRIHRAKPKPAKSNTQNDSDDGSEEPDNGKVKKQKFQTWREKQHKRHNKAAENTTENVSKKKLTDFEKWQMEQNDARTKRLQQHNIKTDNDILMDNTNMIISDEVFDNDEVKLASRTYTKKKPNGSSYNELQNNNVFPTEVSDDSSPLPSQRTAREEELYRRKQKEMLKMVERERVALVQHQRSKYQDSDEEEEEYRAKLIYQEEKHKFQAMEHEKRQEQAEQERKQYEELEKQRINAEKEANARHQAALKLKEEKEQEKKNRELQRKADELEREIRKKQEELEKQRKIEELEQMIAERQAQLQAQSKEKPQTDAAHNHKRNVLRKTSFKQHSPSPREETPISNRYKKPTPPSSPKPEKHINRKKSAGFNKRLPPPQPEPADDPPPIRGVYDLDTIEGEDGEKIQLAPCSVCGRKFAVDRLAKHTAACEKNSQKKRKVFDPVKMRVEGTEHAKYALDPRKKKDDPRSKKRKNNWRTKHDNFIKTIRYAKDVTIAEKEGRVADLPPPPPTENPDYVKCPYCERKFAEATAERHIPKCKEIKSRPAPFKTRKR